MGEDTIHKVNEDHRENDDQSAADIKDNLLLRIVPGIVIPNVLDDTFDNAKHLLHHSLKKLRMIVGTVARNARATI